MSGYDLFVPYISREELEARACAWRYCFGVQDRWAPDLARLLEHELPKVMPKFALRIQDEMPDNDEGRTWHSVPAIDLRADVYDALCHGQPRARFTAAHELAHFVLHTGESRPRAVKPIASTTIPRSQSSEGQANDFAASFLMPEQLLRREQFNSPSDLAAACNVSLKAAEIRMLELRQWPKARQPIPEVEEFLRKMKEQQKRGK